MPSHVGVEAQQQLPERQSPGLGEAEADVVAERADVGDVVVDALELKKERPELGRFLVKLDPTGLLDGQAVGEVVADRAVSRDALGERDGRLNVASLEEPLDAPVHEPQPRLHLEDRLADDRESEVPGLDEAGVDRTDGDLVDAGAFDLDEGERTRVGAHRWRLTGVVKHRVPPLGPVLVEDERPKEGVPDRHDPEQVVDLAFEAAGWERELAEGGHRRIRADPVAPAARPADPAGRRRRRRQRGARGGRRGRRLRRGGSPQARRLADASTSSSAAIKELSRIPTAPPGSA